MAATSRSASPTSGSSEHRYKQAAATVQPPEPGDSPQPQPSAGEESRQAAGHQRPGQTPHAGLPLSRAQGPQERRRQSRPCSGKSTRVSFTGACAYRSRGSARGWAGRGTLHRTTTGRPARTGSACGGHRAWSAPEAGRCAGSVPLPLSPPLGPAPPAARAPRSPGRGAFAISGLPAPGQAVAGRVSCSPAGPSRRAGTPRPAAPSAPGGGPAPPTRLRRRETRPGGAAVPCRAVPPRPPRAAHPPRRSRRR